jgi:hypothetical protein
VKDRALRADHSSSTEMCRPRPTAPKHRRCVGALLLPFVGGLASRVSSWGFVRAVIADDGLHRAYRERGAFLTADGERYGAQNHAILPRIDTASIRAFAGRAEPRSCPHTRHRRCSRRSARLEAGGRALHSEAQRFLSGESCAGIFSDVWPLFSLSLWHHEPSHPFQQ